MGQRRAGFYSSKHLGLHVQRRFEQKNTSSSAIFCNKYCTYFFRLKYIIMQCHAICLRLYMYILPSLPVSSFSNQLFLFYPFISSFSIYLFLFYLHLPYPSIYLFLNSLSSFSFFIHIFFPYLTLHSLTLHSLSTVHLSSLCGVPVYIFLSVPCLPLSTSTTLCSLCTPFATFNLFLLFYLYFFGFLLYIFSLSSTFPFPLPVMRCFWPPGSGSVSQMYRSGSFISSSKNSKMGCKCMVLSKSNKQKNLEKKAFCWLLESQ